MRDDSKRDILPMVLPTTLPASLPRFRLSHWLWASLTHTPWVWLINALVLALALAVVLVVAVAADVASHRAQRDAGAVGVVVAGQGSPLQWVLATVYHTDVAPSKVPWDTVQAALARPQAAQHIASSVALALGDTAFGARIVGVSSGPSYAQLYGASLANGQWASQPFDAVVGATVAAKHSAAFFDKAKPSAATAILGAQFVAIHGLTGAGDAHAEKPYRIVGVLAATGSVIDQLILTPLESVWQTHGHDEHDEHDEQGEPDEHGEHGEHGKRDTHDKHNKQDIAGEHSKHELDRKAKHQGHAADLPQTSHKSHSSHTSHKSHSEKKADNSQNTNPVSQAEALSSAKKLSETPHKTQSNSQSNSQSDTHSFKASQTRAELRPISAVLIAPRYPTSPAVLKQALSDTPFTVAAVNPEIARLWVLFEPLFALGRGVGYLVALCAALTVLLSVHLRLQARRHDVGVLRLLGVSGLRISVAILAEAGLMWCIAMALMLAFGCGIVLYWGEGLWQWFNVSSIVGTDMMTDLLQTVGYISAGAALLVGAAGAYSAWDGLRRPVAELLND